MYVMRWIGKNVTQDVAWTIITGVLAVIYSLSIRNGYYSK